MRGDREKQRRLLRGFGAAILAVTLSWGLWLNGSPGTNRLKRADERRSSDLAALQNVIERFYSRERRLPASLTELSSVPDTYVNAAAIVDPESATPYEYAVTGPSIYSLCAVFALSSDPGADSEGFYRSYAFARHGAGRTCFELKAPEKPGY